MSNPSSKRRTRKAHGAPPRAVSSARRTQRADRERTAARARSQADRTLGTVGERPPGIFGGLPVSEVAIFAGMVALIVGLIDHGGPALEVGIIVMALGVTELTAREHFSGFRSHTTLLAFMPAVVVEATYALIFGVPTPRILVVVPAVPIFALCFWLLRRHFRVARHARIVGHQ